MTTSPPQVSVPGRFQLLEVDLAPRLPHGARVARVTVKLFKRSATLRVDMELADGAGAAAPAAAAGGPPQLQAEGRQQQQQQQQQQARRVVDWWSSGASASGASAPSSSAPGDSGGEAPSDGEPAAAAAPSLSLSLHASMSETDLFMVGLRATSRSQASLRRFGAPAAAAGATAGPGGARE